LQTFVFTSLPKRIADRVIARHLGLVKPSKPSA